MAYIVDTCVWIDVEAGQLSTAEIAKLTQAAGVVLSPVVVAELRWGAEAASNPAARLRRFALLARLEATPLLVIDRATGQIFGKLAAHLASLQKQPRRRTQDIWLASQCIQHRCPLLTRNSDDFHDIPALEVQTYELPS